MSHELRTPMNGVVGMTELLARTSLSPAQARLTRTIRSSAEILLQTVNDLLDVSKIRAGKVTLEELPLDVAQIVEECLSLSARSAEANNVELVACPPAHVPGMLIGDPLRVRQILTNLIGNAVKFTSRGEVVVRTEIRTTEPGHAVVEITVADTGIGMDAATIGRIFEPFTQADESTTRRFGGSGLGLAICRELAELMGGTISVESQPQVGSTFSVSLPVKVDVEAPLRVLSLLPRCRARILTRHPALSDSLARHLSAFGLVPVEGQNAGAGEPDGDELAIVDASGYEEELRELRRSATSTRVVVLATAADIEGRAVTKLFDPKVVVAKPVRRDELHAAIVAATQAPAAAVVSTPAPEAIGGHVLLVEDEAVNAAVAEGYLSALGCTFVWAKDGAEAVARSAAERFDLILMDLSMPEMDGFAATALIRQRERAARRVPIVALTAHDESSYRDKCLLGGMDDLLTKPYSFEECANLLRRWIARRDEAAAKTPERETSPPAADGDTLAGVDAAAVAGLRSLRAGGHADLYSKLVDLFRAGSAEGLAKLREALDGADFKAAGAICHKLSSSAANVGARAFARDVRQLEQSCAQGDDARARRLYERLVAAHPRLIEALMAQQLKASA
jgi:CheY-like chemotaxis protein/HPt (histidine-containing phosphotransfer) domain-containing protein